MPLHLTEATFKSHGSPAADRAADQALIDYFLAWTPPAGVELRHGWATPGTRDRAICVWDSATAVAMNVLAEQFSPWQVLTITEVVDIPSWWVPAMVGSGMFKLPVG